MFSPILVAVFVSFGLSVVATDVTGKIQWNDVCPGISSLGAAKVVLDAGKFNGGRRPDVPVGTYILSVARIDVLESTFEARPYSVGTPSEPGVAPTHVYFVPAESFNIMGMMQNPMMLMMLFGGIMVFAMPYLMKNIDPEAMKDIQEQQAKMTSIQSAMASGDLKAGFSALLAGDEAAPAAKAPSSKNKNKNNKRR
ncbi:hypothetical protein C8J57DRAFT_1268643 [Mycena rebaudengoi]|nr:hypothetical protein C8J57DRAFT_1268643 [Mycena rebaudengoi]